MIDIYAKYGKMEVGATFDVHFVWRLADGDLMRAIFVSEVLGRDDLTMRYFVWLRAFKAGRQDSPDGRLIRERHQRSAEFWPIIIDLVGHKVELAFEAAEDDLPIPVRISTLNGQHDYFTKFPVTKPETPSS